MITEELKNRIKQDVTEEFESLEEYLQTYLEPGFDVDLTKQILQTHVPKEVFFKAVVLLNTLLNYLMDDALERLKDADVRMKNAFFDADFRARIREWAIEGENKLSLEPEVVKYSFDPRLKQGLIASGITFVAGTGATVILAPTVVGTVVAGIVTIILSALAFKVAYDKATPKTREVVKRDIKQYLDSSQKQVLEWLESVMEAFYKDFQDFCQKNGYKLVGGAK